MGFFHQNKVEIISFERKPQLQVHGKIQNRYQSAIMFDTSLLVYNSINFTNGN